MRRKTEKETQRIKDAIELVKNDLRVRERLFQVWGMTWEEADKAICKAIHAWMEEDRLDLEPTGFGGS